MRFVDPYNVDLFEEWLKKKMEEYEAADQYVYTILVKEILRQYRHHKENERDCSS